MSDPAILKTRYDSHPAAVYLTISNLEAANSFTQEMFRQLIDYIREANEDPTVRVIVLRGDGDRFFSSGLSMEMLDNINTTDAKMAQWKLGKWAREAMAESNKIIVSAVKGACAGAGFELSLDDYGSGYSNMSYMLNLPFKMIKIDKYIVWAAFTDKRAEKALAATIKMIKEIGMTVLAEGVETPEQAEWLTASGCDYLQGFYFSRPIPKKDFLAIMKENIKR